MILLGIWGRNYSSTGALQAFPAQAWTVYLSKLDELSPYFDGLQLPPASITASGTAADGDGYGVFCYRDLDGTYWGNKADLVALAAAMHVKGMKLSGDAPFRQMDGENGGPGVFTYKNFAGSTTASWFQYFGQPGEKKPPFVAQDDIPNTQGDTPYGRVRSFQHCIPTGAVEADAKDILADWIEDIGYDMLRLDEAKAIHVQSMARIIASQPKVSFYCEYMDGNPQNLYDYITSAPMDGSAAVEDYAFYWHLQQACNGYDAQLLNLDGFWGFFQWRPDLAVGFFGNPDVTPSRGVDDGISEQIVFNLGIAAAILLNLPMKMQIVDGQAYWPASATFPNCYGLQPIIDNICWFARTFAIGAWAVRWLDADVAAYTRDGDGGAIGWSGGCLVAANFNTYVKRTMTLQTTWPEGQWVHDYSHAGGCTHRDFTVGSGGLLTISLVANAYSGGTSFALLAPGGVS